MNLLDVLLKVTLVAQSTGITIGYSFIKFETIVTIDEHFSREELAQTEDKYCTNRLELLSRVKQQLSMTLSNCTGFVIISSQLRMKQAGSLASISYPFKQAYLSRKAFQLLVIVVKLLSLLSKNLKFLTYSLLLVIPCMKIELMQDSVF